MANCLGSQGRLHGGGDIELGLGISTGVLSKSCGSLVLWVEELACAKAQPRARPI